MKQDIFASNHGNGLLHVANSSVIKKPIGSIS